MFLLYMLLWSVVMTAVVGIWNLRSWRQLFIMLTSSWSIILVAYLFAIELADNMGLDMLHFNPLLFPDIYFKQGLLGWLILLIIPCGWLSPSIGLNIAQRWETT